MWAYSTRLLAMVTLVSPLLLLQGCNPSDQAPREKVELKAAPKLSNDATAYAEQAWSLINEADPYVYRKQLNLIDDKVRIPVRKLSTDWRINVKMTDSVTEGRYALCRKALTSLDIWARATLNKEPALKQKQLDYERDKAQCGDAITKPSQGNTSPKSG